MSFTYYRKFNTPKDDQADSRLTLNHKRDVEQRDLLTKGAVERRRYVKEEKSDLRFEFTPTHPSEKKRDPTNDTLLIEKNIRGKSQLPLFKAAPSKPASSAKIQKGLQIRHLTTEEDDAVHETQPRDTQTLESMKRYEGEGRDISSMRHRSRKSSLIGPPLNGQKTVAGSQSRGADGKRSKLLPTAVDDDSLNVKKIRPQRNVTEDDDNDEEGYYVKRQHLRKEKKTGLFSPAKPNLGSSQVPQTSSILKNNMSTVPREPAPSKDRESLAINNVPEFTGAPSFKGASSPKSGAKSLPSGSHRASKADQGDACVEKRKLVRLEDVSMSYWDFVYSHRCERIILSLSSKKSEWDPSYSLTLQSVYDKFINQVRKNFYPPPVIEVNPENGQLLQTKEKYLRILKLLEREKAELELSSAKLEEFVNKCYARDPAVSKTNKVDTTVAEGDARNGENTEALPDPETLLSDQERILLMAKPDVGRIDLSAFVGMQTKIDAVELWSKQIGMINNSFELKTSAISSIMRKYKIPDSPNSLLRAFSLNY